MSFLTKTISTLSLGSICLAGIAFGQKLQVGQAAPDFNAATITGQRMYLKDLQATGSPLFLYFINESDPISSQASNYINRIVKAYTPSSTKWYGVINVAPERAHSYQAEFNPPYQLLLDTGLASMQTFKAESSPTIVEIDKEGKIAHVWAGLSGAMMKSLNRAVARANGKRVATMDFSQLPSTTQFGQAFVRNGGG
jgi:peroxiredoxin